MLLLVLLLPFATGDTRDEKLFSAAVLSALNASSQLAKESSASNDPDVSPIANAFSSFLDNLFLTGSTDPVKDVVDWDEFDSSASSKSTVAAVAMESEYDGFPFIISAVGLLVRVG